MTSESAKQVKKISGEIIKHGATKTAVIKVTTIKVHPKYHKRYMVSKKYVAHDERDEYKVGDKVEIIPCRPMSATKRFVITRKIA